MSSSYKAACEIMALVDEFPSEPFSYERKMLTERIEDFIANFTNQVNEEQEDSFNLGFDTGYNSASSDMRGEYIEEIQSLESRIIEMDEEIKQSYDEGFAAGIEFHQD